MPSTHPRSTWRVAASALALAAALLPACSKDQYNSTAGTNPDGSESTVTASPTTTVAESANGSYDGALSGSGLGYVTDGVETNTVTVVVSDRAVASISFELSGRATLADEDGEPVCTWDIAVTSVDETQELTTTAGGSFAGTLEWDLVQNPVSGTCDGVIESRNDAEVQGNINPGNVTGEMNLVNEGVSAPVQFAALQAAG